MAQATRVLVTGATGFVGRRLLARLAGRADVELGALARRLPGGDGPLDGGVAHWLEADLGDREATRRAVRAFDPGRVFHLGGLAHPGSCARDPVGAFAVQVAGTAGVLGGLSPGARLLFASTVQVYGPPLERAFRESDPALARTAYGRSKRAAEAVLARAGERGVGAVVARPFNHSGAGQEADYVLPALARSVRRAAAEGGALATGNLFPERDFLHVEDVLDAYELLMERGQDGGAYQVCRGETHSIAEILDRLEALEGCKLERTLDPARVRADDPPRVAGENARLTALGWQPRISLAALVEEIHRAAEVVTAGD